MDGTISELAQRLLEKLSDLKDGELILVGLCGIPASGKSTLAVRLVRLINEMSNGVSVLPDKPSFSSEIAIYIGLDGWHHTRATLDTFDDPKAAHDRRGAPFTFDGEEYVRFVKQLHSRKAHDFLPTPPIIYAPSFSHELKDPTPDAIAVLPTHRIVVIEGLYTFLDIEPWREAAVLFDERLFVELDVALARERIVRRHVTTGVAKDEDEAKWRAHTNDIPNGLFVIENMLAPTQTILSIDDSTIVG